jgi:dolichyl-phosphate-mannose--protein O-mannosyl transferase
VKKFEETLSILKHAVIFLRIFDKIFTIDRRRHILKWGDLQTITVRREYLRCFIIVCAGLLTVPTEVLTSQSTLLFSSTAVFCLNLYLTENSFSRKNQQWPDILSKEISSGCKISLSFRSVIVPLTVLRILETNL